jgi:hypothetical protein
VGEPFAGGVRLLVPPAERHRRRRAALRRCKGNPPMIVRCWGRASRALVDCGVPQISPARRTG